MNRAEIRELAHQICSSLQSDKATASDVGWLIEKALAKRAGRSPLVPLARAWSSWRPAFLS